ncbi:uncharacterized protein LOC133326811 [Musca vetustissima]|uniref:uncharacterized protein LOC133326811 n=1 Tax=Musca vetustissima TaxID=27455 RepID=UPI002AB75A24|nr:uncharacterized protein LOC133326811 [Musca vetustissima]
MSISKIRVRSAITKNSNPNNEAYNITNSPLSGKPNKTTDRTTTPTPTGNILQHQDTPKKIQKQKSNFASVAATNAKKILQNTSMAAIAAVPILTGHVTNTAMAKISIHKSVLPQNTGNTMTTTSLLKIEPFVPSLNATRPPYNNNTSSSKTIRRSYSTLSTAALKKRMHTNFAINLAGSAASHYDGSSVGKLTTSPTPKMLKLKAAHQTPNVRRRPPLRGNMNRQRSKSTSSSNSASNRPNTSMATVSALNMVTPPSCTTPNSTIVIPQPNGICRIQRHARDQEKLPDRINYDKRGLTAIPIFENEPNLRLLSLQHNLINTFHIPKEETQEVEQVTKVNANMDISKENQQLQRQLNSQLPISHDKFSLPINSPSHDLNNRPLVHPSSSSSPMALNNVSNVYGAAKLNSSYVATQKNKLLQRSANLNHLNLQQPTNQQLACNTSMRFSMRKSKSFVNNFQLQYQLNKRNLKNLNTKAVFKRLENFGNLKSFDSASSTATTSNTTTLSTIDASAISSNTTDSPGPENEDHNIDVASSELEIKNKQLLISYGNIFSNLVFLDLYDNQIERISNLDGLRSLSVLLLGKNRISDISGLSSLKSTLRVLDLHGNKICSIANKINCLRELKSLNLAGNQIRQINHNDFMGLANLKELNLKRNKLKRINGFQHLCALERLWLCHNDLHKVDDMSSVAQAPNIIEITIENNPVSLAGDCVSFLVSHLPKLQSLSQMPITEQVREAAMIWRNNKELCQQNNQQGNKEAFNLIRREEIISNARTNWELLRSQQFLQNSPSATTNTTTPTSSGKCVNKFKGHKRNNNELEKINETNEQSYEEFIKLPPIEAATASDDKSVTRDEHNSSAASSLGPNVNSSSSCYTSADEQEAEEDKNPTNQAAISPPNTPIDQMNVESKAINAPTLNIEFPLGSSDCHNMSQHQTQNSNQTSLINANPSSNTPMSLMATTTSVTKPKPSAAATSVGKRHIPVPLMRSQTIVGTGGFNGGCAIKANANMSNSNNKPQVNITTTILTTNNNNSCNILRFQSAKLNTTNASNQQQAAAAAATVPQQHVTSPHHIMPSTSVNEDASPASSCNSTAASSSTTTMNVNKLSPMTTTATVYPACTNPNSNGVTATSSKVTAIEREREQGGDYLIEICGRYLNIYGQGALRFIDKLWNPTKANDVHTLNFSYINFNNITAILSRVKVRFPHAEHFVFRETNIHCLGQLNALAELQGLTSLNIDPEGNPLTNKVLWRQYAIYRLSHWGLKTLNGLEVTTEDVDQANIIYAGLSDLILWSMPDAMLHPLLARLRLDESCSASKMLPKQWLLKPDNRSLRLVVGKEALQWKKSIHANPHHHHHPQQPEPHILPTPQQVSSLSTPGNVVAGASSSMATLTQRERGKIHFTIIMENTCHAVEKLHKLEQLWPMMLLNIVRTTLLDYSQLDVYIRDLMAEIMK